MLRRAGRPDLSAVLADDPLHRGESDPGSREFVVAVKALKDAEQLRGGRPVESYAIVLDAPIGSIARIGTMTTLRTNVGS